MHNSSCFPTKHKADSTEGKEISTVNHILEANKGNRSVV